jgi:TorA maturation chaperone TorD
MISRVFSFWKERDVEELKTEEGQLPCYEDLKVLIITCIGNRLSPEDKIALYLKACVKVYENQVKQNQEILKNWEEFLKKFIDARACEFRLMKEVKQKAADAGYFFYLAKIKGDTNPKNMILAVGLVPKGRIDELLY